MPNLNTNISSYDYYGNISEYFSDSLSIEIAELQRRIILPVLPKEVICNKVLKAYEELGYNYITAPDVYKNMYGNFYIPMVNPLIENGKSVEKDHSAPEVSKMLTVGNVDLVTNEYKEYNYIELMIPKYIVLQFRKEIPAGTKFVVSFTGGSANQNNTKIIALSEIGEYTLEQEPMITTKGMEYLEVLELVKNNVTALIEEYEQAMREENIEYGYTEFEEPRITG